MSENKVVIITGASSGIGAEVARQCAAAGWRVIASGRNQERLAALAASHSSIEPVALDVCADDAPEQLLDAGRKAGKVRGIVHSAGYFRPQPLDQMTFADWDASFNTNVRAAARLLQASLTDLEKGGTFIGIGSTAGIRPVPNYGAYCASKGALVSFLQTAALELAPRGIRAHVVAPGVVDTPMVPDAQDKAAFHPLGRVGTPADVAAAVVFLLSDQASWMTGVVLPVDGGISLT